MEINKALRGFFYLFCCLGSLQAQAVEFKHSMNKDLLLRIVKYLKAKDMILFSKTSSDIHKDIQESVLYPAIIHWYQKVESLKNLINDVNQRHLILKETLEEPASKLEKWAQAGFELEIRSVLEPFFENLLNKLNQGEISFSAVELVFCGYLKSRYASPSMLDRVYDYLKIHESASGLEAIALSPNITQNIFQDMLQRSRQTPEVIIAPNGAQFASEYHWAFRRLFANPLNFYSDPSEIEAAFNSLQEYKRSIRPMNQVQADLYAAQNPRLSHSAWLELFGIYFQKYINQSWLHGPFLHEMNEPPDQNIKELIQNKNAPKDILESLVFLFYLPKSSSEKEISEFIDKIVRSAPIISRDELVMFFRSTYSSPRLFQVSGFFDSIIQSPLGLKVILENSKRLTKLLKGNICQINFLRKLISLISKDRFNELDWGVEKRLDLILFMINTIESWPNSKEKESTLKLMVDLNLMSSQASLFGE